MEAPYVLVIGVICFALGYYLRGKTYMSIRMSFGGRTLSCGPSPDADVYKSENEGRPRDDFHPATGELLGLHNWPSGRAHPQPGFEYPNGDVS